MVEYALLTSLLAIALIASVTMLKRSIHRHYDAVGEAIKTGGCNFGEC